MLAFEPLVSVVVVSRNDEHGGNLLKRMQLFVTGWLEQAKRFNLKSELIIVEWNPLPNRPRLAQVLKWPEKTEPCIVRFIEVPPELHYRFKYSDKLPVFQMIGKNVGIRRARGKFVLATNIDILFSDEIVEFFAKQKLQNGHMYRVDRYDVPSEIPQNVPIEKQLEYCRQHVIRINTKDGIEGTGSITHKNSSYWVNRLFSRIIWLTSIRNRAEDLISVGKSLHTFACGDFTLMDREHWQIIRGYPEYEMYSFYLDGLGCYSAHYSGAKEVILKNPMRIYHIEHAAGSGWSPGIGEKLLNERLNAAGIPQLSGKEYTAFVRQMRRTHRPIIFNKDDNWGLNGVILKETII